MTPPSLSEGMLETLQRDAFAHVANQVNLVNGLVSDTTEAGAPASIAVVGFALGAYPVGVERGLWPRGGRRPHADDPSVVLDQLAGK